SGPGSHHRGHKGSRRTHKSGWTLRRVFRVKFLPCDKRTLSLLAIRDPDILHLRRVLEKPAALALLRIEPIDRATFVRPHLLQIPCRIGLGGGCTAFVSE